MQENMKEYFSEKEARERRLAIYTFFTELLGLV